MRILTVFNSKTLHGAQQEYRAEHVRILQRQIWMYEPDARVECLSDQKIDDVETIPLKHGYPGWWAKMELFRPDLKGDFLFMDLDTVIVGPMDSIARVNQLTLLRDWYRDGKKLKEGLGGGLMFLPELQRAEVWNYWKTNPAFNMRLYSRGDQFLFERLYLHTAKRWQDVVPGQLASWKVTCKNGVVPPEVRVITFHGKPRPWEVPQFAHLYR